MSVEVIHPASRAEWLSLREPTIGASEVAAVLGAHPSPQMTPFALWARRSGLMPPDKDNKYMRRGRILEPIALDILHEERPDWVIRPNPVPGEFYRDLDAGLSCTPDAYVQEPETHPDGFGICQIKTVDPHVFRQDWMIDGDIQLPPYVAIQAMQEAHLTGASWVCVAALVGFDLDLHIIEVRIHAGVIARIKREVPDFLRRVRENDPPDPDYGKDGEAIAALYDEDDGGTIDLAYLEAEPYERVLKLVTRRQAMKEIEGAATEAVKVRRTIDAELIHMLGNAARGVLADGRVIEAKTVRRNGFTVEPTSYRSVKIKTPKRNAA